MLSFLAAVWLCAQADAATTRTVTSFADNQGNPFSLRTAISQSTDGDTIVFSDALSGFTINLLNSEILINCNLTIIGPADASISIVGGSSVNSPNKRVFHITAPGAGLRTVQISGLQIQGSVVGANGTSGGSGSPPAGGGGGGIFAETSTLLIVSNCYFAGCRAVGGNGSDAPGGDCVAPQRGGDGAGVCGGAMYCEGDCFLLDCTFNTNSAVAGNGATGAQGGAGGNGGGAEGGAVCIGYHNGTDLKLLNCTFYGNTAYGGNGGTGGVGYVCILQANPAPGGNGGPAGFAHGGAISINEADIPATGFIHSTVYNNFCSIGTAGTGGAGVFGGNPGQPGMAAIATGCGLFIANQAIPIGNSIFCGNYGLPAAALPLGPDVFGPVQSSGFNLICADDNSGPWAVNDQLGMANNPLDARLGSLQFNGGDMPTIAPLQGSPAIDAGTQDGLPFDQIGQPRPVPVSNRVYPGSDTSDVGAVEIQCSTTTATPVLNIGLTGTTLTISWPAPSFCYVLQQSVDLLVWVNSTFTVNTIGAQNQVVLNPAPDGPLFFRLSHL